MDTQEVLRQTVADFLQIEPDQVTGELNFRPWVQGSVARARLEAVIRRRLSIVCPAVHTANTYGELEAAILGEAVDTKTAASLSAATSDLVTGDASSSAAMASGPTSEEIACGIDIESPESLPVETDYWQSDFYRANFSPAEIAYCISQLDPRQSFAARWCAKEALKKCDANYMPVEMNRLEVVVDKSHRPAIHLRSEGGSTLLPVAVSLTHIGEVAAAIVIRANGQRFPKATSVGGEPTFRKS